MISGTPKAENPYNHNPGIPDMIDHYDFDDELDRDNGDSDEDTEDASETDMVKNEEKYTEMKDQMYQEKLRSLKEQLRQLDDETHPEYARRHKKLEASMRERKRLNDLWYKYELDRIEREYVQEKKNAAKEFEEKKVDLRENLIMELEDRKKNIEYEHNTMELSGDSMDMKPISTRKLRRRPNEPIPVPEKRRKTSPSQLSYLLEDDEIMDDLRNMSKSKYTPPKKPFPDDSYLYSEGALFDARIEDGKLFLDKKWFNRSQPVIVDSRETGKFTGVISAIGNSEVWIRKTSDNAKVRIFLAHLQRGKFIIRRR